MSIEIPLSQALTVDQAIAAANAAKISAQQALADIPAAIDAEVGPASAPYIAQSEAARDAAVVAKTAAETARDNALAAERRIRQQSLGTFADDATAVAWAAAQTPPIAIVTGTSYLNSTTDVFRYAVVSAGPTIAWHDVTEDEAAQAALATASASAAAASLQDFLSRYVGAFSSAPTYVGGSPPWGTGAIYWNTLAGKFKVWQSGAWVDYDATAQQAATDATGARDAIYGFWCGAAAADPTTKIGGGALTTACIYFNTVSGKLRTYATGVWRDYDKDAQDAAALATSKASDANAAKVASEAARDAAAGSATGAGNSKAAVDASLLQAISYAALAQAGAASVSAQTGLSILAAAQRAIALMTDGAATFWYDTRKDSDGGAWVDKCVSQSMILETLNTATRGATAKYPKSMLLVGRNSATGNPAFTIYDGSDPTLPMWGVFIGATANLLGIGSSNNINGISALNGVIYIAQGGSWGATALDLISDTATNWFVGGREVWTAGGLSTRNAASTSWVVNAAGGYGLASSNCNSIAATIAPNTPLNPLRCNLPNPTVFAFTNGGVSTLRWDGVVVNSASTSAYSSGCVDNFGNVWMINSSDKNIYVASGSSVLAANWATNSLALFTWPQIGIETMVKISAIGNGMVAIAGVTGLARIKLDPANPANSLINVKTTTYDTGWMVLGKTVLAMAESSADVSTLTASGELVSNGAFASDLSGWISSNIGSGNVAAWSSSNGGSVALPRADGSNFARVYQALSTVAGKTYALNLTAYSAGIVVNASLTSALGNELGGKGISVGAGKFIFTATSATTYISFYSGSNATAYVNGVSCKLVAADRSGSENAPVAVGAPTRAVVASGADTAAYSGFSSSAWLEVPYSSSMDVGTGDVELFEGFVNLTSNGTFQCIFARNAPTNDVSLYVNTSLAIQVDMPSGSGFFNSGAAGIANPVIPSGVWTKVELLRLAGVLTLRVNGVTTTRKANTDNLTLTNAVTRYGVGATVTTYPLANGKLALLRYLTAPKMPDQSLFSYADEAPRFSANAIANLSGATPQGIAYDPDTDQLAVAMSTGGVDIFSKSTKAANDNGAAGVNKWGMSEDFSDSAWTKSNATITKNAATGPFSNTAAHKLIATASLGQISRNDTGSWPGNKSIYAQQADARYLVGVVDNSGGISGAAAFDLQTGTILWQTAHPYFTSWAPAISSAKTNGFWRCSIAAASDSGGGAGQVRWMSSTTAPVQSAYGVSSTGFDGVSGIYIACAQYSAGVTLQNYAPGLSQSANAKAIAFAGGDLVAITANGVDAFIAAKPGLGETAKASGAPKRAAYDPTFGIFSLMTTDATPTVAVSTPIPEGKAYRIRDTVSFVQVGGVATEKAAYVAEALVTRDLGGNVVVSATTTTINETTASMDYVIQADTTAQTCEGKPTGKASTRGMWVIEREVYDAGLQTAA